MTINVSTTARSRIPTRLASPTGDPSDDRRRGDGIARQRSIALRPERISIGDLGRGRFVVGLHKGRQTYRRRRWVTPRAALRDVQRLRAVGYRPAPAAHERGLALAAYGPGYLW